VVELAWRKRVRITVVKKLDSRVLWGKKPPVTPKYLPVCEKLDEGQVFIVEDKGAMPEGFCPWAWDSITREVTHLQFGGDFPWFKEKGKAVSCCSDAIRPVVFKLERLQR